MLRAHTVPWSSADPCWLRAVVDNGCAERDDEEQYRLVVGWGFPGSAPRSNGPRTASAIVILGAWCPDVPSGAESVRASELATSELIDHPLVSRHA